MEEPIRLQRAELAPGITVNYVQTDKFKVSTLTTYLILPLAEETATQYALLPHVLDRGCVAYPTQKAICRRLEELYAASVFYRVFKRGEWQVIEISMDVLDNGYIPDGTDVFGETVALLRSLLTEPLLENGAFLSEYTESEKKNLKDRIRSKINHKTQYAIKRCCEHMFAQEPFGISAGGEEEQVDAITPKSLTAAYHRLLSEARIEVMYVGRLSQSRVFEAAKGVFGGIARTYSPQMLPPSPRAPKGSVRFVEELSEAVQGKLVMGFRLGHFSGEDSYAAMPLLMEVLYHSPTSKLFMNVREKLSLCYYCTAVADGLKGMMLIHSGIENENKTKAESAILGELEAIKEEKITAEEWDYAQKSLENAYQTVGDSPSSLCNWYLTRILRGDAASPTEVRQKVLALTPKDVSAAAARISLDLVYFLRGVGKDGEEADCDEE